MLRIGSARCCNVLPSDRELLLLNGSSGRQEHVRGSLSGLVASIDLISLSLCRHGTLGLLVVLGLRVNQRLGCCCIFVLEAKITLAQLKIFSLVIPEGILLRNLFAERLLVLLDRFRVRCYRLMCLDLDRISIVLGQSEPPP